MPNIYDFILGPKSDGQTYVREIETDLVIEPTTLVTRLTGLGDTINTIIPVFCCLHFIIIQCPETIDINIGIGNIVPAGGLLGMNICHLFMYDSLTQKYRLVA